MKKREQEIGRIIRVFWGLMVHKSFPLRRNSHLGKALDNIFVFERHSKKEEENHST